MSDKEVKAFDMMNFSLMPIVCSEFLNSQRIYQDGVLEAPKAFVKLALSQLKQGDLTATEVWFMLQFILTSLPKAEKLTDKEVGKIALLKLVEYKEALYYMDSSGDSMYLNLEEAKNGINAVGFFFGWLSGYLLWEMQAENFFGDLGRRV